MEGLALDSGVCIRAERLRMSLGDILRTLVEMNVGEQVALTAIAVTELVHGIYVQIRLRDRNPGKPLSTLF